MGAEVTTQELQEALTFPPDYGPSEWGPMPWLPDPDFLVQRMESQWGDLYRYRGISTSAAGQSIHSQKCTVATYFMPWYCRECAQRNEILIDMTPLPNACSCCPNHLGSCCMISSRCIARLLCISHRAALVK